MQLLLLHTHTRRVRVLSCQAYVSQIGWCLKGREEVTNLTKICTLASPSKGTDLMVEGLRKQEGTRVVGQMVSLWGEEIPAVGRILLTNPKDAYPRFSIHFLFLPYYFLKYSHLDQWFCLLSMHLQFTNYCSHDWLSTMSFKFIYLNSNMISQLTFFHGYLKLNTSRIAILIHP